MPAPRFVEEIPSDCVCPHCAATATGRSGSRRRGLRRCTARGLVAAAGAAALIGVGAGAASAEPAPSHAGWDGSKYWYQDASGWWRWTHHYDKYQRHTGGSDSASPASATDNGSVTNGHNPDPTFRGHAGWDATDHVYWFQMDGQWWWTSHKERYEAHVGAAGGSSASEGTSGARDSGPRSDGGRHAVSGSTETAIQWAQNQIGKPYEWGGNGPGSFDCSGLVQQAFLRAGISLPRVADAQYSASTPISRGQLRRGDLVFWSSDGSVGGIHHVAVYLGGGQYLEAPRPGKDVRISSFDYYNPNMYARVA